MEGLLVAEEGDEVRPVIACQCTIHVGLTGLDCTIL